jgi:predicted amidophosphoribosyltransferase
LSGNPQTQWNINLGQALLEERKREPSICKMCHKNPAEFSGYCGDCYSKLESDKRTKKVAKHKFWLFSFFHLFDT